MGKEKKRIGRGLMPGGHAKERHRKNTKTGSWNTPAPTALNARLEAKGLKSKHHSYFELVENKDKKKKLEFKITSDRQPPPGFEFVPIGNPELTTACKELSREQDAMIFIVSTDKRAVAASLSHQVNRIGHHIRQTIVEQARASVGESDDSSLGQHMSGLPEPIPETQQEINEQADKAIRDLFPRIPNSDRQTIIEHSFKKGATKKGEPLVGLAKDLTLSRRVQLAVLAHIRHTHTRYDRLLKETTYANARKAVEGLCLDFLVKWRGDEETGRDQLDEILREVIVISDSEGDDDGYTSNAGSSESDASVEEIPRPPEPVRDSPVVAYAHFVLRPPADDARQTTEAPEYDFSQDDGGATVSTYVSAPSRTFERLGVKRGRRGFRRYQAALMTRWDEAKTRVRLQEELPVEPYGHPADPPDVHFGPSQQEYPKHALAAQDNDLSSDYGSQRPAIRPSAFHGGYPAFGYDQPPVPLPEEPGPSGPSGLSGPPGPPGPFSGISAPPMLHRVFSHPLPRHRSPRAGMDQQSNHRTTVRSTEAQDYLVPSIEPSSPIDQPDSSVPILVRTLSPHPGARESHFDGAPARYDARHSPSWGEDPYGYAKHRRITSDSDFIRLPSRHELSPVYVAREDPHGQGATPYTHISSPSFSSSFVRAQGQDDYRSASVGRIAQSTTSSESAPASGTQDYQPRGSMRPAVVDDWPVHAPPRQAPEVGMTFAPRICQENTPSESRVTERSREAYCQYDGSSYGPVPFGTYPFFRRQGDDLGHHQSLKRAADGSRLDEENRYPYDPLMASRPLEQRSDPVSYPYPPRSNNNPGLTNTPWYAQQSDHPEQFAPALPAAATNVQPHARYLRRVDNAWSYHGVAEAGPQFGPSRDTRDPSAYGYGHPPLPPDPHVICSYPDNPEQQYVSRNIPFAPRAPHAPHVPLAPQPPRRQDWEQHASYR